MGDLIVVRDTPTGGPVMAKGALSFLVTLGFLPAPSQVSACSPGSGQCHCLGSALGGRQHPAARGRLLFPGHALQLIPGYAR